MPFLRGQAGADLPRIDDGYVLQVFHTLVKEGILTPKHRCHLLAKF